MEPVKNDALNFLCPPLRLEACMHHHPFFLSTFSVYLSAQWFELTLTLHLSFLLKMCWMYHFGFQQAAIVYSLVFIAHFGPVYTVVCATFSGWGSSAHRHGSCRSAATFDWIGFCCCSVFSAEALVSAKAEQLSTTSKPGGNSEAAKQFLFLGQVVTKLQPLGQLTPP